MPPRNIGPYRVVDSLGSGGAGTVYRAIDRRTNEAVAVKLLRVGSALDPKATKRLVREFETLVDLSHPHVVRVIEAGVHDGYPYLAMELVEGLTLRAYLSLQGAPILSAPSLRRPPPSRARSEQRGERGRARRITPSIWRTSTRSRPARSWEARASRTPARPDPGPSPTPRTRRPPGAAGVPVPSARSSRRRCPARASSRTSTAPSASRCSPMPSPSSATPWRTSTRTGSSTATSSPATSWSTRTARCG